MEIDAKAANEAMVSGSVIESPSPIDNDQFAFLPIDTNNSPVGSVFSVVDEIYYFNKELSADETKSMSTRIDSIKNIIVNLYRNNVNFYFSKSKSDTAHAQKYYAAGVSDKPFYMGQNPKQTSTTRSLVDSGDCYIRINPDSIQIHMFITMLNAKEEAKVHSLMGGSKSYYGGGFTVGTGINTGGIPFLDKRKLTSVRQGISSETGQNFISVMKNEVSQIVANVMVDNFDFDISESEEKSKSAKEKRKTWEIMADEWYDDTMANREIRAPDKFKLKNKNDIIKARKQYIQRLNQNSSKARSFNTIYNALLKSGLDKKEIFNIFFDDKYSGEYRIRRDKIIFEHYGIAQTRRPEFFGKGGLIYTLPKTSRVGIISRLVKIMPNSQQKVFLKNNPGLLK